MPKPTETKQARPAPPPRYTVAEVAKAYRVSPATVRQWVRVGLLAAINVSRPGSQRPRLLIPDESLRDFDQRHRTNCESTTQRLRRQHAKQVLKDYFA